MNHHWWCFDSRSAPFFSIHFKPFLNLSKLRYSCTFKQFFTRIGLKVESQSQFPVTLDRTFPRKSRKVRHRIRFRPEQAIKTLPDWVIRFSEKSPHRLQTFPTAAKAKKFLETPVNCERRYRMSDTEPRDGSKVPIVERRSWIKFRTVICTWSELKSNFTPFRWSMRERSMHSWLETSTVIFIHLRWIAIDV